MRPTGPPVRLRFDGREIEALPGETIAAALAAADIVAVRQARSGAPRGPFCGMGVCFDCLVTVDGRPNQRACLTKAQAGMDVRSAPVATPRQAEPAAPARGDRLRRAGGGRGTGRPVGGARAGAGRRRRDRGRRAPASRRAVFQAAGALAPGRSVDPRPAIPRRRHPAPVGAAGRRADPERGHGLGGVLTPRGRRHRRRPFDPFPAQAPGAGDRRLRAVAAGAGLDLAGRPDGGRPADPGALLSRGAGPAHRGRRQRPALPADRRRASRRRRQCRRRPRSSQPPRPCPMARSSGRRFGRARPADRRPGPRQPAARPAALGSQGDAPGGRGARAAGRGGRFVDRRRHRGAGLRFRLLVGAGARAGLRPSLRAARQRLDGNADQRRGPHQHRRGLRHRRRRALRRRPCRPGAGHRRRGRDRGRSRPEGAAAHGRAPHPRPLRALPGRAVAAVRGATLRSRRDRRQRHRLPLRGGDGGRTAPADRGRLRHAGWAEAQVPGRHGPLPGPLLRRRRGAHDDRTRSTNSACSRRGRRPSRCPSMRSRSSRRNGAATRISCRPTWRGRARRRRCRWRRSTRW